MRRFDRRIARYLFKLGVVRRLLEVFRGNSIELKAVRNLLEVLRAEVFDRVGSCKEILGEM